jgi:hypothetical protein
MTARAVTIVVRAPLGYRILVILVIVILIFVIRNIPRRQDESQRITRRFVVLHGLFYDANRIVDIAAMLGEVNITSIARDFVAISAHGTSLRGLDFTTAAQLGKEFLESLLKDLR